MEITEAKNSRSYALVRMLLYMLMVGLGLECVVLSQLQPALSPTLFDEGGMVESAQIGVLITCTLLLIVGAFFATTHRQLCWFFAFVPALAVIRELDAFFNIAITKSAWSTIFIVVTLVALAFAYSWRTSLEWQLRWLLNQASFGYIGAAMIVILAASQVAGQKVFWKSLLAGQPSRHVSRAVEEMGELTGYLLLLCAAIELVVNCRRFVRERNASTS